ncbi:peptidase M35 [Arenicella chitinivorans]|uniref:Peptidase M35 n=1 Tax=Arenicella chitinivorans TaxID=1329800 RepID=A0A918RGS5_9GAMM|nr:peptidase M35 [Arenicella chitinivorans]
MISVTYQNQSSEVVRLLQYGTALEGSVAEDFLIVVRNGEPQPYQGILAMRFPPSINDYTVLVPGQSVTAEVDIEASYGVRQVGGYQVYHRDGQGGAIESGGAQFWLTESRAQPALPRQASPQQVAPKQASVARFCSVAQAAAADGALSVAETYARHARDDLRNTLISARSDARRYRYWFGQYSQPRWNRVQDGMTRIYSAASSRRFTFDCACEAGTNRTIAYVYGARTSEIFLCDGFFGMPRAGGDSQASVLVHEISHFNDTANTDDGPHGVNGALYGQGAAVGLAITNPDRAVGAASNYQYFAANPTGLPMPTEGGDGDNGGGDEGDEPGSLLDPLIPPEPESIPRILVPIVDLLLGNER